MKNLLIILGISLSLFANAQRNIHSDSLDFSTIVGSDTVIFLDLNKSLFGEILSVEFDITGFDTTNAYVFVGGSNTGHSFNNGTNLYRNGSAASVDSVQLDPTAIDRIVNGSAQRITAIATAQSTKMWIGFHYWKYFCMKFRKGDETGKLYYYILKP